MYADDTTHSFTFENFGPLNNAVELENKINQELTKINSLLTSNKLVLNAAKSKYMLLFRSPKSYQILI